MNLTEALKDKENGDILICTESGYGFGSGKEYSIKETGVKRNLYVNDNYGSRQSDSVFGEFKVKHPITRHRWADLYIMAANDVSLKFQILNGDTWEDRGGGNAYFQCIKGIPSQTNTKRIKY